MRPSRRTAGASLSRHITTSRACYVKVIIPTNFTLYGSNDSVGLGLNGGATVRLAAGTGDVFRGDNDTVWLDQNESATIVGNCNTANSSYSGVTVGFTGTNDVANLSNGTVNLNGDNESVTVVGNNDTGNSIWSGDTFRFSGTNEFANLSNGAAILTGGNERLSVTGSNVVATALAAGT